MTLLYFKNSRTFLHLEIRLIFDVFEMQMREHFDDPYWYKECAKCWLCKIFFCLHSSYHVTRKVRKVDFAISALRTCLLRGMYEMLITQNHYWRIIKNKLQIRNAVTLCEFLFSHDDFIYNLTISTDANKDKINNAKAIQLFIQSQWFFKFNVTIFITWWTLAIHEHDHTFL